MKIVEADYEILTELDGMAILRHIERIGRVCYKSEDRITGDSCITFVAMLIERGHEAMIEHYSFSVKFVCDRGVSHEIVRHRLASFAQESTRYCNYGKAGEVKFVFPCFWAEGPLDHGAYPTSVDEQYNAWLHAMRDAERAYLSMLDRGASPQEARSVLPNSLKTEIVMTANLREWRHFLRLRTAPSAHPQMREIAVPLLFDLQKCIPVVFDDVLREHEQTGGRAK